MTLPRLAGPRVALVPVPHAVADAVLTGGDLGAALAPLALAPGPGWPHDGTADALRPLAEHGAAGDDGGWLVAVGAEVVGECGWRGAPDAAGDVEISYGIAAPSRRQGLGREAVAVLCAWTEAQPGVERVVAEVAVGNEASRRLLRALGFEEEPATPPYLRCARRPAWSAPRRIVGRHVC